MNNCEYSRLYSYTLEMRNWGKEKIVRKRKELLKLIDGDVFYTLSRWPKEMQTLFWKKPLGDLDLFKMILFFVGNGCPPRVIIDWIISSQFWALCWVTHEKRARQIHFIMNNLERKKRNWFYFDIHVHHLLFLNGDFKHLKQ